MKPFAIVMAAALVWITAAAGCGKKPGSNAEPAPQGTLPELTGARIGPQPGPDRAFPEIDNPYGMGPNVLTEGRQMFVGSIPGETRTIAISIYDRVQAFDDAGAAQMSALLLAISLATIALTFALSQRIGRRPG